MDISTNQICEVDLGATARTANRVTRASWSPDGRYLALAINAQRPGMLIQSNWLRILDTATGQSLTPDMGVPFAWESFWLPDNRRVIVFGQTSAPPMGDATDKLFLVDVVQGTATPLQTNLEIGGGDIGSQMALSPDGHTLAITCPLSDEHNSLLEYRICTFGIDEVPVQ
jgi:dipeptidyl aminopeptidase/acylaminoacyl peptidase